MYQESTKLPEGRWFVDSAATFAFSVPDADAAYDLYYDVRYGAQYPYYNLFVTYYLLDSAGRQLDTRLQELTLMHPTTGAPYGKGFSDLYDQRVQFARRYEFPYAGPYQMRVVQYMREDPLPQVYNFGLRVEKYSP